MNVTVFIALKSREFRTTTLQIQKAAPGTQLQWGGGKPGAQGPASPRGGQTLTCGTG